LFLPTIFSYVHTRFFSWSMVIQSTTMADDDSSPPSNARSNFNLDYMLLVETLVNDITPEYVSYAVEDLFRSGVADAWVTSAVHKNGRIAHELHCLCHVHRDSGDAPGARLPPQILRSLAVHVTSSEYRTTLVRRFSLHRTIVSVKTKWSCASIARTLPLDGRVDVKVALWNDKPLRCKAEYDHCRAAASVLGIPMSNVADQAIGLAAQQIGPLQSTDLLDSDSSFALANELYSMANLRNGKIDATELLGDKLRDKAIPMMLLEANIDDMTSDDLMVSAERLRQDGATDVWFTPIVMKKGRAAYTLHCLFPLDVVPQSCAHSEEERVSSELSINNSLSTDAEIGVACSTAATCVSSRILHSFFMNTSTLGVRMIPIHRLKKPPLPDSTVNRSNDPQICEEPRSWSILRHTECLTLPSMASGSPTGYRDATGGNCQLLFAMKIVDASARGLSSLVDSLLSDGASDVWSTLVVAKHSGSALVLSCSCRCSGVENESLTAGEQARPSFPTIGVQGSGAWNIMQTIELHSVAFDIR
jgi:uncharacterized protein (DUF111 family)